MFQYFKNLFAAKSFQEGIRPLMALMALSGVNPYNYELSKSPKTSLNIPVVIYSVSLYSVYLYSVVTLLIHNEIQLEYFNTSKLLKYTMTFKVILGFTCLILLSIEGFIFTKRYAINLNNFVKVDRMMTDLGIKIDYGKLFKESLLIVGSMETINLIFEFFIGTVISTKLLLASSWKLTITFYGPGYFSEMCLLFYGMCAYLVKIDINRINQQLAQLCDVKLTRGMGRNFQKRTKNEDINEDIIKTDKIKMEYPIKVTKYPIRTKLETNKVMKNIVKAKRINMIFRVYDKICDITDGLYDAYSFKILFIVTYCFISLVLNLFYVLGVATSMYFGDYSDLMISLFCVSLHQSLMNIVFVVFIATMCEQCGLRVIIKIYIIFPLQIPVLLIFLFNLSN